MEIGESIESAAVREVKEETGIDIEIVKFCGIFQNVSRGVVATVWLGRAVGGVPTTSAESLEVGYFTVEEAMEMITWANFRDRIRLGLDERQHPFFVAW